MTEFHTSLKLILLNIKRCIKNGVSNVSEKSFPVAIETGYILPWSLYFSDTFLRHIYFSFFMPFYCFFNFIWFDSKKNIFTVIVETVITNVDFSCIFIWSIRFDIWRHNRIIWAVIFDALLLLTTTNYSLIHDATKIQKRWSNQVRLKPAS